VGRAQEAALSAAAEPRARGLAGRRRGRLLRHYFLLSYVLLAGGLLLSGVWELYFRYEEIHASIALSQQDAAAAAAARLGQFVQDVRGALTAATRSRAVTSEGLTPDFRFELDRLLLIAPAVTEVVALDNHGFVRARASRLRAVLPEGQVDFSATAPFRDARQGRAHFGAIDFVDGAEPFMTIAVPIEHLAGEIMGVLWAEVSLIYVGENVVSRLTDGQPGYAYVINRAGDLLAHPQVSLVLQRRNVAGLDQPRRALASALAGTGSRGVLARSLQGEEVFSAHAAVADLDWIVFVERPAAEVYRPLYASIRRTALLMMVGLGMALLAGALVARRVLRPLEALRQGVQRIGAGDLAFRLDLRTGDEIETLAEEFNRMSARVQEAYTGLEQKVAERTRELSAVNQQLDQASRLKSQFLANVSHELRTPMNAIIGFTRLVIRKTEGAIPPLQHANLQKVLISAEHLLSLINGLLDLSKIEAGHVEVRSAPFELKEVVQSAVVTVEPMLRAGRVRLATEIAPDVPTLNTDREKLRQILLNLLGNAAKFTDEGVITVAAWCAPAAPGMLKLAVTDTGIGIPRDALEYIFEAFRQVDMSSTRRHGGTGLGLAITRRLARVLGGDIVAESEPGRGSTFTLTIPVSLARAGEPRTTP
jgi:signal transduction histidine kinase